MAHLSGFSGAAGEEDARNRDAEWLRFSSGALDVTSGQLPFLLSTRTISAKSSRSSTKSSGVVLGAKPSVTARWKYSSSSVYGSFRLGRDTLRVNASPEVSSRTNVVGKCRM